MLSINRYNFNTFQTTARKHGVTRQPALQRNTRLVLMHNNDAHGNTDEMALSIEANKNFDKQYTDCATFKLSGGDNYSGGDISKNGVVVDIMDNFMGIDFSAVGNHEMDAGLKGLIELAKSSKVKFIATNVKFDDDFDTKNVIHKSIIKEEKGEKYGFIGAMPLDFTTCTKKTVQEGVEVMDFEDSVEALQEEIDKLREQGVNKIIFLSHSGYETDKKYATSLDGVDIIVGGHSHTPIEGAVQGENVLTSKSGEPVIILQAGENGKYYGVLDVEFNKEGVLTKISNTLTKVFSKKNPNIEYIKDQKMGASPILGTIQEVEKLPTNRRVSPHAWANMVVDSMRAEFDADIAFLNAANVRKVPAEGRLTERDVVESVPMKNQLIRTKVTQKQVVDAIKQACKESLGSTTGEPGLLFPSGLTYKVDNQGNLLELNFIDKKGNKTPIDINNPSQTVTYTAIYDTFTMMENGEYPQLAPKFEVEYFDYDKDQTAINYIYKMQNKDSLKFVNDNRIEIIQTSQQKPQGNNNQKFLDLTVPKAS